VPGHQQQPTPDKSEEMLSDNDRTEIAEYSQQPEKKSRINKIAPMSMDELAPG
jgi:hypothetical protein